MRIFRLILLTYHALLALGRLETRQNTTSDILDWVDPLIGSKGGGNVFTGATLQYGMAKGALLFS